ncbi:hypothetical protein MNBD_PLANCTO03-209 [hydrothermal vent metagenome]|uniref:Uncharacterized protein n=1 Tax=hydrothermal vent metagenome TaxID=652676 RepID=A0A3B1E1Q1_9ZZZZ
MFRAGVLSTPSAPPDFEGDPNANITVLDLPAEGPCFEVYFNSPMDTKPDDLLTAIHVPIAES